MMFDQFYYIGSFNVLIDVTLKNKTKGLEKDSLFDFLLKLYVMCVFFVIAQKVFWPR